MDQDVAQAESESAKVLTGDTQLREFRDWGFDFLSLANDPAYWEAFVTVKTCSIQYCFGFLPSWRAVYRVADEVNAMSSADYVDPEGYWIDPDGSIHRMGNEDGDQKIIATVTEVCSHVERILVAKALSTAARSHEKPKVAIGGICPICWMPLAAAGNFDWIDLVRCPHCDALFEHGKFVCYGAKQ